MPTTRDLPGSILERLPLPTLKMYAAVSTALLSASVYYAVNVTSDPNWKNNSTEEAPLPPVEPARPSEQTLAHRATDVATLMMQEPLCIWTVINMAYCLLAVLGTQIQRVVFGPLRVSEQQHVKDKLWNFVFYKFILIFGVINVQYMDEVVLWCSWFTALGFLHLLAQLCKERFQYLSNSPTVSRPALARLLALLLTILAICGAMMVACITVAMTAGLNTFALMSAECILLATSALQILVRYVIQQLYEPTSDTRAALLYYITLVFDMWSLGVELAHHVHMLLWSNMLLSMASLVILMQLRYLLHEMQARVRKHRMYLWVLSHMGNNYPMATDEEVAQNCDNCAICWEKMETARKLPCGHLFHNACLSSWLQQDTSCPTCRRSLPAWGAPPPARRPAPAPQPDPPLRPQQNHLFYFDGSRYVSWLPSFSVEVTSVRLAQAHTTSQLDAMARQVQQLFPHYPLSTITSDLQLTHSIELTVDNILDGRLPAPAAFAQEPAPPAASPEEPTPEPTLAVVAGGGDVVEEWAGEQENWEVASAVSTRFSKNSSEREKILQHRKEALVGNARRKYLERQARLETGETATSNQDDGATTSNQGDDTTNGNHGDNAKTGNHGNVTTTGNHGNDT